MRGRVYFDIPYPQWHEAKAKGIRWDMARKHWYADTIDIADLKWRRIPEPPVLGKVWDDKLRQFV